MSSHKQKNVQRLKEIISERTSSVVTWVGAGLSQPARAPGWDQLKQELILAIGDKEHRLQGKDLEKTMALRTAADNSTDYWEAFSFLRQALGGTTYRSAIKDIFKKAASAPPPKNYHRVWKFSDAIITTNIDGLAKAAFIDQHRRDIPEISGLTIGTRSEVLQGFDRFIINIHGKHDEPDSWVFTREDLNRLWSQTSYKHAIKSILLGRVVVFVGITVDDISILDHFNQLKQDGLNLGKHYWITHRKESAVDQLAEELGISTIIYNVNKGSHRELDSLLEELGSPSKFSDPTPGPIVPSNPLDGNVLPRYRPDDLIGKPENEIRLLLNSYAKQIFTTGKPVHEAYPEYRSFCDEYARAIHASYYTSTTSPHNLFMSYDIVSQIDHSGAFGSVFKARDETGRDVAIKLLKKEVFSRPGWIESFRRGAASMQILTRHGVKGAVQMIEAFEIPTSIVMEFIEGTSLLDAVASRQLRSWSSALQAMISICATIREAHELSERVLHRDIRPHNVMIRNFYVQPDTFETVILDFDLSWHRYAAEDSIHISAAPYGYLAPEQLSKSSPTRDARVDVFGLGMTLYYILTGNHPVANEQIGRGWSSSLRERILLWMESSAWKSTPSRIGRLIDRATQHKQEDRCSLLSFLQECTRILEVETSTTTHTDLWAEELASRADLDYSWDSDNNAASATTASGFVVTAKARPRSEEVQITLQWQASGTEHRKNLGKYLAKLPAKVEATLTKHGYDKITINQTSASIGIDATINIQTLGTQTKDAVKGFREARDLCNIY